MTIQWPSDSERSKASPRRSQWWGTTAAGFPLVRDGELPNARNWRDVLVVLVLIALAVLVGVLLWNIGPLPRVFPLMS